MILHLFDLFYGHTMCISCNWPKNFISAAWAVMHLNELNTFVVHYKFHCNLYMVHHLPSALTLCLNIRLCPYFSDNKLGKKVDCIFPVQCTKPDLAFQSNMEYKRTLVCVLTSPQLWWQLQRPAQCIAVAQPKEQIHCLHFCSHTSRGNTVAVLIRCIIKREELLKTLQ